MLTTILLENVYNAPWPKEFNAEPFFIDEDLTPVTRVSQIKALPLEMQKDMAKGILDSNEHLKGSPFWNTYLYPLITLK